ncbi:hypothetical protein GCM10010168_01880 [Actinoplanes ianthinogenes]|uniref:Beta-ketoacyl synthase N-terminal domain-containing protein n=1 Tax=Actinoplanes ianthinogenes TaxID=122358 RepID=A0ABM7LUS5_9ACTN|nr:hypothetical protein Aiant_37270 [Actinoplanes ianthinogenes]GGQ90407.1 hypothetical protein GCM10010168_01880 [Actinoplanes ianthinogenes]
MAERHQFDQLVIGVTTGVVPDGATGIVDVFREALGAPAIQKRELHRGHLPSLVSVPPVRMPASATGPRTAAAGRIRTNARHAGPVTGAEGNHRVSEIDISHCPIKTGILPAGAG